MNRSRLTTRSLVLAAMTDLKGQGTTHMLKGWKGESVVYAIGNELEVPGTVTADPAVLGVASQAKTHAEPSFLFWHDTGL